MTSPVRPDAARQEAGGPAVPAMIAWVIAMEVAALTVGLQAPDPLVIAWLAFGVVYFLLAYRAPEIAWMAAFAAIPLSSERPLAAIGAISVPSEPMIGLGLAAWGLRSVVSGSPPLPRSRLHVPLAALALTALVSIPMSDYPWIAVKAWLVMGAYVAFGLLYFASTPWSAARRERWIRLACLCGGLVGAYGFARVLLLGVSARTAYGAGRPFFPEHGTYSAFLGMILPIAILETLERRGRSRAFYLISALMISLGLVFSFARAAWISMAVTIPCTVILWAISRRSFRRLAIPSMAAVLLAIAVIGAGVGSVLLRHARSVAQVENLSNLERVNRWMAAERMIRDRPWFGVGYGAFPEAYPSYRRKAVVTQESLGRFGVHSEPLRLWSEMGLFGLIAGAWWLAVALGIGVRAFRRSEDAATGRVGLALAAGIAGYAVHGLFNSYLGMDKVTLPFWLLVGGLVALGRDDRDRRAAGGD